MPDDPDGGRIPSRPPPDEGRQLADDLRMKLAISPDRSHREVTEDHILSILFVRRGREEAMGRDLFSDPAWDILLELYAAHLGKRRVMINDLAQSIGVPQSTTARWVKVLSARGLVSALNEEEELVGWRLELTPQGEAAMERLVHHWGSAFRSI